MNNLLLNKYSSFKILTYKHLHTVKLRWGHQSSWAAVSFNRKSFRNAPHNTINKMGNKFSLTPIEAEYFLFPLAFISTNSPSFYPFPCPEMGRDIIDFRS